MKLLIQDVSWLSLSNYYDHCDIVLITTMQTKWRICDSYNEIRTSLFENSIEVIEVKLVI